MLVALLRVSQDAHWSLRKDLWDEEQLEMIGEAGFEENDLLDLLDDMQVRQAAAGRRLLLLLLLLMVSLIRLKWVTFEMCVRLRWLRTRLEAPPGDHCLEALTFTQCSCC